MTENNNTIEKKVTFCNYLIENVYNTNYSKFLTENEKNYIKNICFRNPELYVIINKFMDNIREDGNFDFDYIPKIIFTLFNTYKTHIIQNDIEEIHILNIIKFTMDTLLDSGIINIPYEKIKMCKSLVGSSVDLLAMDAKITKTEETTCCSYINKLL